MSNNDTSVNEEVDLSDTEIDIVLSQFGMPALAANRSEIVALLQEQIVLEKDERGNQWLMSLLSAQLFSIGTVEDCLIIWEAKSCCFDTMLGIDAQFLCGAGLKQTKAYLQSVGTDLALDAMDYLTECENCGNFNEFVVQAVIDNLKNYYKVA
jgi:hypothetical protein